MQVPVEARRVYQINGTGDTGGCQPPDVGVGNLEPLQEQQEPLAWNHLLSSKVTHFVSK